MFDGLKGHASATGYDTFTDVDFPKNVKQLGFKVERIRSALQKFNIDIRKGERSSQGNTYRIRYIEPSQTTPSQQVKIEQCVTALKETIELVKDNAQTLELFACPYCDHNSNTLEILERHAIKAHPNKPFADDYDKQTRRKTAEA